MEKSGFKFISREEIEDSLDPIVLVIGSSYIESLACNIIGDRELTDIELNRIAHFWDCDDFDLDMYLISRIKEALGLPDKEWKKTDDEFKARQGKLLENK